MKLNCVRWSMAAVFCTVAGAGCAKKSPPPVVVATRPVQSPEIIDSSSPAAVRSREVSRLSEEYARLSHQLPGHSSEEHRQLMHDALDKMDQILSRLAGPNHDLAMQENLLTLEQALNELAGNASDVAVEPAIDSGLRSAYTALMRIAADKDFSDQDFSEPMKDFKSRLDELDSVHGLTHQVVVAEAVDASTAVVSKMADVLASRIAPVSETTTAPSSQPTTEPATQPATAPAN